MGRAANILYGVVTLLLLLAIAAAGYVWHLDRSRANHPGVTPDPELYPVQGIDISAHNGAIDFRRVEEAGVDFVYIKATEGATFKDRQWASNHRRARREGLPVGAYHFFRFDISGHLQALNLLHSLRGRDTQLPPAIDVEEYGNAHGVHPDSVARRLDDMLATLRRYGHNPVVYTNKKGLERYLRHLPDSVPLWISAFTDPPLQERPWLLWQHTHRGAVSGISGAVDINTVNGPLETLLLLSQ